MVPVTTLGMSIVKFFMNLFSTSCGHYHEYVILIIIIIIIIIIIFERK